MNTVGNSPPTNLLEILSYFYWKGLILMQYSTFISLAVILLLYKPAHCQSKSIFVGEIHGVVLDSFKKKEIIPYEQFKFSAISAGKHRIEIRLYETGFPSLNIVCTVLTYDTAFNRDVYIVPIYPDSSEKPRKVAASQENLKSIFRELVENGIFSVESINRDSIKSNYRPMYLTPSGVDTTGEFWVSDGSFYFLEYKVDKYYDQQVFVNPEAYSDYYRDNQMLRRQKEIVLAIRAGIKY